jgi:hypothetical protein
MRPEESMRAIPYITSCGTDRTVRASGSGRPAAELARRRAAGTADEGITGARGCAVTAPSQ